MHPSSPPHFPASSAKASKALLLPFPWRERFSGALFLGVWVFGRHVRLCSDHSSPGRQVLCRVRQCTAMALLDPVFPLLSSQCGRCHRGSGTSENSSGLTIDRGDRKPSPQSLSGAAVFVAWRSVGVARYRRNTRRDELGRDNLSRETSTAGAAGVGLSPAFRMLRAHILEHYVDRVSGPKGVFGIGGADRVDPGTHSWRRKLACRHVLSACRHWTLYIVPAQPA